MDDTQEFNQAFIEENSFLKRSKKRVSFNNFMQVLIFDENDDAPLDARDSFLLEMKPEEPAVIVLPVSHDSFKRQDLQNIQMFMMEEEYERNNPIQVKIQMDKFRSFVRSIKALMSNLQHVLDQENESPERKDDAGTSKIPQPAEEDEFLIVD